MSGLLISGAFVGAFLVGLMVGGWFRYRQYIAAERTDSTFRAMYEDLRADYDEGERLHASLRTELFQAQQTIESLAVAAAALRVRTKRAEDWAAVVSNISDIPMAGDES